MRDKSKLSNSEVKGSIFSKTSEYLTFATHQAAKGAAALDAFEITLYSKLDAFWAIIFCTLALNLGVTCRASKLIIVYMTPALDKNARMPCQVVSV